VALETQERAAAPRHTWTGEPRIHGSRERAGDAVGLLPKLIEIGAKVVSHGRYATL
jgi:hypothetical protein